ncbi:MAG TPA: nitrile hydratase subunit alpha [Polyangiaceae bacterium]
MKDAWLKIITKAWSDQDFKDRLLKETDAVLAEYNIAIPPGVTYQVVEDQAVGQRYLVLPPVSSASAPVIDSFNRSAHSGDPGF